MGSNYPKKHETHEDINEEEGGNERAERETLPRRRGELDEDFFWGKRAFHAGERQACARRTLEGHDWREEHLSFERNLQFQKGKREEDRGGRERALLTQERARAPEYSRAPRERSVVALLRCFVAFLMFYSRFSLFLVFLCSRAPPRHVMRAFRHKKLLLFQDLDGFFGIFVAPPLCGAKVRCSYLFPNLFRATGLCPSLF